MAYQTGYYQPGMRSMQSRPGRSSGCACNRTSGPGPIPMPTPMPMPQGQAAGRMAQEASDSSNETVTMAYVPWQHWGELYSLEKGFCRGTIFPVLDKPFKGAMCS